MSWFQLSAKDGFLRIFLFALVVMVVLVWRLDGPSVKPLDAPADAFSAARAFSAFSPVIKEGQPHPAGTHQNHIVRNRLIATLTSLGLEVSTQDGFSCGYRFPGCSTVSNIVAIKKGQDSSSKAVLFLSHYDSVPAAPAASDDGMGVATALELARALTATAPTKNDVIILITDAEEVGLKGAALFAEDHPLMARVGVVVNVESRGVTGPSMMFETSQNNNGLIDIFKSNVTKPTASSLTYEVYKRMPNDTDVSVFKKHGTPAINFAHSWGVALYHSQLDDLDHMDQRTLQHHGDNALASVLAFANMDLDSIQHSEDATYFDLFGLTLVKWSSSTGHIRAAVGLLLILVLVIINLRSDLRLMNLIWGIIFVPISVALVVGLGYILSFPLGKWVDLYPLDHPYPWAGRIALISAAFLGLYWAAKWAKGLATPMGLMLINWLIMAALATFLALVIPGASYMFLAPIMTFMVGAMIDFYLNRHVGPHFGDLRWASRFGLVAAIYIAIYHFVIFELVLNFQFSHFKMIPLLPLMLAATPVIARYLSEGHPSGSENRNTLALTMVVATIISMMMPTYTLDRPRGMNLTYIQNDDTGSAVWDMVAIGNADMGYLAASGFPAEKQPLVKVPPYPASNSYYKKALNQHIPAPQWTVVSDDISGQTRTVTAQLKSVRGGNTIRLIFPADANFHHLRLNGKMVLEQVPNQTRTYNIPVHGIGTEPVEVTLSLPADAHFDMTLQDIGFLAVEGEALDIIRNKPANVFPIHGGNTSVVIKTVRF